MPEIPEPKQQWLCGAVDSRANGIFEEKNKSLSGSGSEREQAAPGHSLLVFPPIAKD
jgi:hypothetical protein